MARSGKAGSAEKAAAEVVLKAATQGRLEVHVVRTKHILGEPTAVVLERSMGSTTNAARLATSALDELARSATTGTRAATSGAETVASATEGAARATQPVAKVLGTVAKGAVVVGVAADIGLRVHTGAEIEGRFARGELGQQGREVAHARNAAGMVGGWGGAWAGMSSAPRVAGPWAPLLGASAPRSVLARWSRRWRCRLLRWRGHCRSRRGMGRSPGPCRRDNRHRGSRYGLGRHRPGGWRHRKRCPQRLVSRDRLVTRPRLPGGPSPGRARGDASPPWKHALLTRRAALARGDHIIVDMGMVDHHGIDIGEQGSKKVICRCCSTLGFLAQLPEKV